jgi:hypothetical protein
MTHGAHSVPGLGGFMQKISITALIIVGVCSLMNAQHTVLHLQDVRNIYVPALAGGNNDTDSLISAKLIGYLAKHHEISVVEAPENADAVLKGTVQIQSQTDNFGRASYKIQGAMRLVNKEGMVLWADDVSNSYFAQSASSSFAENVAKKLLNAMFPETSKK